MSTLVALGAQWGDEGKGKVVDLLASQAHAVVRFQGGQNAGHTLLVDGKRIVLHVVPSGVLHPHVSCFIGNGVVLAPTALLNEVEDLERNGVSVSERLWISASCPLLLRSHQALDAAREGHHKERTLGTTKCGIGPAYEDKVARRGLRWGDLLCEGWRERVVQLLAYHNFLLSSYYQSDTVDEREVLAECERGRVRFGALVVDVAQRLFELHEQGKNILLEGAQGAMLDLDHGTYPFVTSSNTTAGAAAVGSGLGVRSLDRVVGVAKAYTTRVGDGPMVSELSDESGVRLGKRGAEVGATTGRARRCGWLDMVRLREAVRLNSMDALCLTKLDVLDGLDEVPICTGYEGDKESLRPLYTRLPGWSHSTRGVTHWRKLPENAVRYVETVEELAGVPVELISTGPAREETVIRKRSLWST